MRITKTAYQSLVDEDLQWLATVPRTLERDHVKDIVEDSPRFLYDVPDELAALTEEVERLKEQRAACISEMDNSQLHNAFE